MLQATITGKTKETVRFTKPIGGLMIKTDQLIENMTGETAGVSNELIGIQIESGQAQSKLIQPKQSLKLLALMSTVGEGHMFIDAAGKLNIYIPIADGASLYLDNSEEIVVSFETLKSAKTYEVYGIEMPGQTRRALFYEHKKLLSGRTSDNLNVIEADLIGISSFSALQRIEFTKATEFGGEVFATNHEFESAELEYLMSQTNDIIATNKAGTVMAAGIHDAFVLPVAAVTEMDVETNGTELDIIMRVPKDI